MKNIKINSLSLYLIAVKRMNINNENLIYSWLLLIYFKIIQIKVQTVFCLLLFVLRSLFEVYFNLLL